MNLRTSSTRSAGVVMGVVMQQTRNWTKADWTDFVHVGPGTLAGEYLRTFWHPIVRTEDLAPGRATPIKVMGEDLTLYRGEDGAPHCLAFRCAHRGTQLSTGWVEGDNLRCFYHGWVYDGSGQCIEQPAEPEPFCQRIKIRSYPAAEYIGLIFIYMGEGEPPPMYHFPQLEDKHLLINRFPVWPCSYWNRQENDPVHVAFVHREGPHGDIGLVEPPRVWAEETDYGMAVHEVTPGGIESTGHRLMPAMTQFIAPDGSQNVGWKVPIDDTHCIHPVVRAIPLDKLEAYQARGGGRYVTQPGQLSTIEAGEAVLRGELNIHDPAVRDMTQIVQLQDYASMVAQGAIPDFEHEHLGQSDRSLIFWRGLWERELRSLAEGRPLKRWTQSIYLTSERHYTDAARGEVATTTGLGVLG